MFLLLIIITLGATFYSLKNRTSKEITFSSFLEQQYSGKPLVKSFDAIGDNIISVAKSNTVCCGENSWDPFDEKATPSIIITNADDLKIKSIYEVSFTNSSKENRGNLIKQADAKQVNDVFIGEWSIYFGGSSGSKGLAVFKEINGKFQPVEGLPLNLDENNALNLTDKIAGQRYFFPSTSDSFFTDIQDLNKDGIVDLLFADWDWNFDKGESHYQDRPWNLQVFELVDNKFRVAKWWNNGRPYKTPENIGYFDEAETNKLREMFAKKINL